MFKTFLKHKKLIARDTWAFYLEKPEGFDFKAGQSIDLRLLPSDVFTDDMRSFSIASAPFEEDIMIAIRMRDSEFKRRLSEMPLGSELLFDGPFGSMVLHNNHAKPAVFLVAGIGITPFRSMMMQATYEKLSLDIYLISMNRHAEDIAFHEELSNLQSKNSHLKLYFSVTRPEASHVWTGLRGRISEDILKNIVGDINLPVYYIAGPPTAVSGVYQILVKSGIDTDIIRTDEFAGY
jgi:ferredoxin-NADP reductase